jgi:hypothetical protein
MAMPEALKPEAVQYYDVLNLAESNAAQVMPVDLGPEVGGTALAG